MRMGVDHVADCAIDGEIRNIVDLLRVFDIMALRNAATPKEINVN